MLCSEDPHYYQQLGAVPRFAMGNTKHSVMLLPLMCTCSLMLFNSCSLGPHYTLNLMEYNYSHNTKSFNVK